MNAPGQRWFRCLDPAVTNNMQKTDFLVVGAGIAGASVAARLAEHASVRILETESQPGYHSTGRSAAFYAPDYGNATIRAMTMASRNFFIDPDPDFTETALFTLRDRLYIGADKDLDGLQKQHGNPDDDLQWLDGKEVCARYPILSCQYVAGALLGSGSGDLDVGAILQGFLRSFKNHDGLLETDVAVKQLEYRSGQWNAETTREQYSANVIVNAAGAWADQVTEMSGGVALGLSPFRRTALLIPEFPEHSMGGHPMVMGPNESFYFKPDAGAILVSPADETLSPACDAQPEEMDIALAVDVFERCTGLKVPRVTHSWAGLRTFAPDRTPVVGFDDRKRGFFILAGQGGYGVQTAPAMSAIAASILLGNTDFCDALDFPILTCPHCKKQCHPCGFLKSRHWFGQQSPAFV